MKMLSARLAMLLCGMLSATIPVSAAVNETATEAKPWQPTVVMTDEHKATCLVFSGDTFPNLALPDLDGKIQQTGRLLGKNLSVIMFWTSKHAYALEQFRNLTREVVAPFADQGVAIIAINEGNSVGELKKLAAEVQGVVNVRDDDGTAFAKVATGRLPRTYLVDGKGKILWMDIEYSQSTRRELNNALRYFGRATE